MMRSNALARFMGLLFETPQVSKAAKGAEKEGIRRLVALLEEIGPVPVTEWVEAIDSYHRDRDALLARVRKGAAQPGGWSEAALAGLEEDLRASPVEVVRRACQVAELPTRANKAELIEGLVARIAGREDDDEDDEEDRGEGAETGSHRGAKETGEREVGLPWIRSVAFCLAEAMTGPDRHALERVFALAGRCEGPAGLAARVEAAFEHDPLSLAAIVHRLRRREEPETILGEILPDLTSSQLGELCAWAKQPKRGGREGLEERVVEAYQVPPRDPSTAVWMAEYLLREIEEDVFVKEDWTATRHRIATGLGRFCADTLNRLAEEVGLPVHAQKAGQLEEFRKHLKSISISRSRTAHVA